MIGFINRPREAAPHTIANIESSGVYTMNYLQSPFIQQAHQTSSKFADNESEFEMASIGIEWKENFAAPFVAENQVKYSMKLVEIIPIRYNSSFFIPGKVQDVFVDESIIDKDGHLHTNNPGSICTLGIDGYYTTGCLCKTRSIN